MLLVLLDNVDDEVAVDGHVDRSEVDGDSAAFLSVDQLLKMYWRVAERWWASNESLNVSMASAPPRVIALSIIDVANSCSKALIPPPPLELLRLPVDAVVVVAVDVVNDDGDDDDG